MPFPDKHFLPASLLTLALCAATGQAEAQGADEDLTAAQALHEEATTAMDAKDFARACPKLEEVVKLVPQGVGARIELGRCYEGAGRLASAYTAYALAEGLAEAVKQSDRQKEAHERAEALKGKLARLTITLTDAMRAIPGLEVRRDGVVLGAAQWGTAVPVDKGSHTVSVTAPGRVAWTKTVDVTDDGVGTVVIVDVTVDKAVATQGKQGGTGSGGGSRTAGADQGAAAQSLSHRRQLGAVLRADINGQGLGVIAAPGLSYGLGDHVDLTLCALLGRDKGVEAGVTVLFLPGAWKPRFSAGVPVFFLDDVHPGIRGAAGVQWDPIKHFGVFLEVGVAGFPTAPEGYDKVVFVPSLGIQPRL